MKEDMSFLKENKVFNWLTSCLSIVLIGITEYFFYSAFTSWVVWKVAILMVADLILISAFSLWLGITILKTPTLKKTIVFVVVYTLAVAIFAFGATTICHLVKNNASASYFLGIGIADVIIVFSFVFGWALTGRKNFLQALVATVALMCSLLVVLIAYIGNIQKNDATLATVKEFRVKDNLPDGNGKKIKVILLNGQSNASGVSRVSCLTEEQKAVYGQGVDNVYINYFCDNGYNTSNGFFTQTELNQGYADGFFGPEVGIANALSASDDEYIILKYTWGGTILDTQWYSPRQDGSVGPLYTAFINFTATYMDYLLQKGYDAKIGAMCWMQGESDSIDESWTQNYYQNTVDFVASLRKDLNKYADEGGIRYIDAGISDSPYWTRYTKINDAKKQYANDPAHNAVYIDTIAAGLDYTKEPADKPDLAHYDASSEIRLGQLFGEKILERYN